MIINNINKEDNNHFTNLTYQDFWEDKILLLEYNMTPNEIIFQRDVKSVIINNQHYDLCWYYNKLLARGFVGYKIEISFSLKPFNKYIKSYPFVHQKFMDQLNKDWRYECTERQIVTYRHRVLLNWEDIMDRSYLDFIIKSVIKYVKHLLETSFDHVNQKKHLEFIKQFNENPIHNLVIIIINV